MVVWLGLGDVASRSRRLLLLLVCMSGQAQGGAGGLSSGELGARRAGGS